ncbi:hypothetical protein BCR41DRAFT_349631 [Lobosporangium transversale]|uniref:Uncharacterized protein n=1 Tax=Lobosporangium transversale TaxID=64571 RepID=A0A1Y2GXJ9_9FUNG|nr:hypothetical protein BCR41DRAFT_349631 [Lobosporangium transversale]ORZ22763.1 hypothetical protein BCR41DRAFT_349631 [Lobosporangium transversale]|eukprot:XP_021883317.1 hypothetical protein BCR41DRAFT_349631 [Lobosporangium transversale]
MPYRYDVLICEHTHTFHTCVQHVYLYPYPCCYSQTCKHALVCRSTSFLIYLPV